MFPVRPVVYQTAGRLSTLRSLPALNRRSCPSGSTRPSSSSSSSTSSSSPSPSPSFSSSPSTANQGSDQPLLKKLRKRDHKHPEVIFSGIQPSGQIHLGNYLGALSTWVNIQSTAPLSTEIYYSLVGLHAITLPKDPVKLVEGRREMLATLLACGIDVERSCLYFQDMVPQHAELAWILNCITPVNKLKNMTTWKSKIATFKNSADEESISETDLHLGLFAYPVLQAADILLYKATMIPVGEDQQQHLELAREIADTFNHRFSPKNKPFFPAPQALITPSKRILSLRNASEKMSKSAPHASSRIHLTDSSSMIQSKLRSAITDSLPGITFDPVCRPGVSNLLTILAACQSTPTNEVSPAEIAGGYGNMSMKDFKLEVADAVESRIGPIRSELDRLMQNGLEGGEEYLRDVARKGAERAERRASVVLAQAKELVGLGSI
ncbi:tryptophanyl-trna synthetase [Phaffia rhodozyma]|uniref:Tryptophan--tRNA ligase, mitochondrial n=1 Tax=Phaffia rhodozyma TaxID=264483 RepID=A0A0F7SQC4_PHARH|nr:tryptophanyl-trna synthetase [Phaffia rhodozyma]